MEGKHAAAVVQRYGPGYRGQGLEPSSSPADVIQYPTMQIKFVQGTVQTPELLQDIEIPEAVTVLGQSVDLTALKSALQPVTSTLRSAVAQVATSSLLTSQPLARF